MQISDNFLIDIAVLAVIFGPLPVSFFTYGGSEPYVALGFFIAYCIGALVLGYVHIAIAALLVPVAWYFALKPIMKKSCE